ncbi:hypothetical protein GCM10011611_43850 [Aliidongia dinghuensis]|uniref:Uncharacterized protein n=1 Tax=Aliidongia dinghuensis TaxID=1867774 RepID=A0A8J2YXB5_9PROT|nr:hypothetical protein [Aliidongia dinghuensis]GGF32897.1 hypothetical protein GCM10011611_43850 [Aliidongia dinghuensis]
MSATKDLEQILSDSARLEAMESQVREHEAFASKMASFGLMTGQRYNVVPEDTTRGQYKRIATMLVR